MLPDVAGWLNGTYSMGPNASAWGADDVLHSGGSMCAGLVLLPHVVLWMEACMSLGKHPCVCSECGQEVAIYTGNGWVGGARFMTRYSRINRCRGAGSREIQRHDRQPFTAESLERSYGTRHGLGWVKGSAECRSSSGLPRVEFGWLEPVAERLKRLLRQIALVLLQVLALSLLHQSTARSLLIPPSRSVLIAKTSPVCSLPVVTSLTSTCSLATSFTVSTSCISTNSKQCPTDTSSRFPFLQSRSIANIVKARDPAAKHIPLFAPTSPANAPTNP